MTDSEEAGDGRFIGEWLELKDCWDGSTKVGERQEEEAVVREWRCPRWCTYW